MVVNSNIEINIFMVFFFYGVDSFRIRQKVNLVIGGYQAKHKSGLNLCGFDFGEAEEFGKLKNFLESYSMFAEKKLSVVNGLFGASKEAQEDFMEYLKNRDVLKTQEKFLVVAQELALSEDKKSKQKYVLKNNQELFKALINKNVKVEEFDHLAGAKLEAWIRKEVESVGAKIDDKAVRKLALFVGADLWQMKNEIDKLAAFANAGAINESMVDELVKSRIENDIFKTVDALAARNKQLALTLLHRHLAEGESEIYLLSMLVYQFRNLLLVKSEIERGVQFQALVKTIKLHPFVLRKSFEQGKGFTLMALKKIYERLLELDIATKSGRIEPQVALDLVVREITG
ncbi:MAG: polymerase III, delta subunit protein [Parcubacteria group bacterium GW2011_GWA2_43_9b]|uniref:DNA-directed DNA polymerase n=1 Tax=Candidatus Portnoybacteria bacterium RIFCSPLOWO2_02_FULL_39_11 TaxID=1802001 RepID=A0A1G2FWD3_9BACT|nr:MAG: polymerase III, delta subunit protein [Parcubacteria group bacterium GW2011_GWA2_43_9b]OGZ42396.1 MAG: DNA polymerase III subunit delta [Candidatus Portnoybacteria bacterium RIFCSPLOWO2_02_FULL_39_11]